MPVTIKKSVFKYKNQNGQYVNVDMAAERPLAEQIAEIEAAGEDVLESIPSEYTELEGRVDDLETDLAAEVQRASGVEADLATCLAGKINKPGNGNGTAGQILRTDGAGGTSWENAATSEEISAATDTWLGQNITNPSNPPLDRFLSLENAAAPADMVGNLKNAVDNIYKTRTLFLTSSGGCNISQEIIAGKWFCFQNKSENVKFSISLRRDENTYQNCGTLAPGATAVIRAKENGNSIYVYTDISDSTATLLISFGEAIDAHGMNGCYDTTQFIVQGSVSRSFTYALSTKRSYKAVNKGSVDLYIRSSNSGSILEKYGVIHPEEALFFTPTVNAEQINFWHNASSNVYVPVIISEGEIIEAQAHAHFLNDSVTMLDTEINDIEKKIENLASETKRLQTGLTIYDFPSDFIWNDNPVKDKVYTNGKGHFWVDYNVMDHISIDGIDVYVSATGNDSNDGLTSSTPKKTLDAAIAITNARRVHVSNGYYPRQNITLSKDIDIIGDPDNRPMFTSQLSSVTWVASNISGVYTTGHKNNSKLYDLTHPDVDTAYRQYLAVDSITEVEATQGTYYDDGETVTLHTFEDVVASLETICYTSAYYSARFAASGHRILVANLCFICGGSYSGFGQVEFAGDELNRGTYLVYNCDSSRSLTPETSGGGGFHPTNADIIIQKCTSYYTGNDAFSYGNGCKVVEINCASAYNGRPGGITSCNGSTGHGGEIIRIGCAYHDTYGPIVHDVGATYSVNLGLAAWHSTCEGKPNFCASGGAVHMWLDSCYSYSSDAGIMVGKPDEPSPNSVIYKQNCISDMDDAEYGGHIYEHASDSTYDIALKKQMDVSPSIIGGNIYSCVFQAGKWYKIINTGDWKYRVSFNNDDVVVQSPGMLLPNDSMWIQMDSNSDSVNFYTISSTENSTNVIVYSGEAIAPQSLANCWNVLHHTGRDNLVYKYTFKANAGDGVKIKNNGAIDCNVTFMLNGVTVDRLGTVSPGQTQYYILENDVDTISMYNYSSSDNIHVIAFSGEIATAQANAIKIYDTNKYIGDASYSWLCDRYYVNDTGVLVFNDARSVAIFDARQYAKCTIKGYARFANKSSICAYDRNGVFISCLYTYNGANASNLNYNVEIPNGTQYILISCATSYKDNFTLSIENLVAGLSNHYKTRPIDYDPPYFVEGQMTARADFPWSSTTKVNDMHRWYSELRVAFSRNLTMTKLGTSSVPTGDYATIDSHTYDIWAYVYQGDDYIVGNDFILYSGIHGSVELTPRAGIQSGEGMQGMISLAYWFKDMLMNPNKNEYMDYIRKYCRILIVPVVNPWGLQNGTRANGRGVDCNRNWDLNFIPNAIYADTSSGPEAFSENETSLLKDYVVANFPNAKFSIDIHSRGTSYLPNDTRWLIHSCENGDTVINKAASDVTTYMTTRYEGMSDLTPDTEQRQVSKNYFNFVLNIPGILIETASAMSGNSASLNGTLVQIQYTQLLGAFIQTLVDRLMIHPEI